MNESVLKLAQRFRLSRFLQGETPVDHPLTLNHRRIFILPTRRGLGFVVLITLLLLIAFIYNNNLAYLLAFMLGSVFFVTILHSFRALSGLVVRPGQSNPAFVGESAGFVLHIDNPLNQPRLDLKLSLQADQKRLSLAGMEQKTVVLHAQARKRGWLPCETVTLSSSYPLGLFRAWSPLRFKLQALIYPKPANSDLPFPETESGDGEQGQGRKGQEDFYGIKTYQSGDPIRQIHWKALAKGQGLFSKEYSGSIARQLWLDYEVTPGHHLEERLSQLCRWVIAAEQSGLQYGLILPGIKIDLGHGRRHYRQCLEQLALF